MEITRRSTWELLGLIFFWQYYTILTNIHNILQNSPEKVHGSYEARVHIVQLFCVAILYNTNIHKIRQYSPIFTIFYNIHNILQYSSKEYLEVARQGSTLFDYFLLQYYKYLPIFINFQQYSQFSIIFIRRSAWEPRGKEPQFYLLSSVSLNLTREA